MYAASRTPLRIARDLVLVALTWAAVVLLLSRFEPESPWVVPYNSDHAIPLLMANDEGRGLFSAYYFGQDRLGGWPMGVQRAVHNLTGYFWTPESAHKLGLLWFTLGLLALIALHPIAGPVLAAAFLFAATWHPVLRAQLNDIGQPYVQQAAGLCWAWWALRKGLTAESLRARRGWSFAFFVFAALTVWISTASAPLLVVLLAVEVLRLPGNAKSRLSRAWPMLLGFVGSVGFEAALRGLYSRAAKETFGHTYRTSLRLDVAHLSENVKHMGANWWNATSWLTVAGVVLAIVAGVWVLWKRPGKLEEASGELSLAAFVLVLGGLGNLALTMVVNHVRMNSYSDRYLTQTHLWLIAAAICMGIAVVIQLTRRASWAGPLGAVATLGAAFVVAPVGEVSPRLEQLRKVTESLTAAPGPHVLLGDYWRVYTLAALAPKGQLIPLPEDGDYVRTPFNLPALEEASSILVVHEPFELVQGGVLRKLRGEHGRLFRLDAPRTLVQGEHGFSRYRPLKADRVPFDGIDLCASGAPLQVPFGEKRPSRVLLELESGAPALQPAGPIASVAQEGLFVTLELTDAPLKELVLAPGPQVAVVSAGGDTQAAGSTVTDAARVVRAEGAEQVAEQTAAVSPCRIKAAWLVYGAE